jgi:hypothetical protein
MAVIETGNSTSGLANVDGNNDLVTTTPQVNTRYGGTTGAPNYVGGTRIFSENDPGTLSGTPVLASPFTSADANLGTGLMTPLFEYAFNGTAQDTSMWYCALTTMTATAGGGFLTLNASNIGTSATGIYLMTKRYFNLTGNAGLRFGMTANINLAAAANEVWYAGLGIPASATAAPTDGVWFQYTSAGLIGVVSYNSTITQTGALPVANPLTIPVNTNELFQIRIHDRVVYFIYAGNIIGSLATPAGQGTPFMSDALPAFVQYANTGTVSGGSFMMLKVATIVVDQLDSNLGKPYSHVQAAKGLQVYQGFQNGTMGSTAYYANNLAVGSGAAIANATAAAAFLGLGGQFTYVPTLAVPTDGILCSFLVPAGTINTTGRTFYITGVRIQSVVSATLTGGPCIMLYSLSYGGTTLSLATGESATFTTATAKASRRIALGIEQFAATAATGAVSTTNCPVYMQFVSPVVVNPGEYIQIVAKNVGVVTTVGTITAMVTFDGYAE